MKKQQSGFTLIELIAVIVILGILAATALPRFVDLSDAAEQAALEGTAGNIGSAMALNYAAAVAANAGLPATTAHVEVNNCTDVDEVILGGVPTEYTITSSALTPLSSAVCTITHTSGKTTTFQGFGAAAPVATDPAG